MPIPSGYTSGQIVQAVPISTYASHAWNIFSVGKI
jgi:hypothetical protein